MFLLRKESDDESIPNLLNPIIQSYDSLESGQTNSVSAINKEGLSDFGLKFVLKESLSSPNTLCTTPDSYATLVMVSGVRNRFYQKQVNRFNRKPGKTQPLFGLKLDQTFCVQRQIFMQL